MARIENTITMQSPNKVSGKCRPSINVAFEHTTANHYLFYGLVYVESQKVAANPAPDVSSAKMSVSKPKSNDDIFMALLDRYDISSAESWESALKKIIKDPEYSCIRHVSDKKKVFLRYQEKKKTFEEKRFVVTKQTTVETFRRSLREFARIYSFTKYP